jgi:hypothetical protein
MPVVVRRQLSPILGKLNDLGFLATGASHCSRSLAEKREPGDGHEARCQHDPIEPERVAAA